MSQSTFTRWSSQCSGTCYKQPSAAKLARMLRTQFLSRPCPRWRRWDPKSEIASEKSSEWTTSARPRWLRCSQPEVALRCLAASSVWPGFSAYILAAQASAFIPLVSGPGLVSFVSVMSNPVTLVAGTVGAGWWLSSSANQRIRAIVATRAVAMLAIQGLSSGRKGLDEALKAFASIDSLPTNAGSRLDRKQISQYQNEWILLKAHARSAHKVPSAGWGFFDRRVVQRPPSNREGEERLNAAAYGAMTVGDVLYHAAQISPEVIAAADFSYLADIDGSLDFALLAAGMGDGAVVRLKGYVAEQIVAAKLQAAGHVVTFADSASEPGWDLRVDGQPVQVKFHDSVEGIREHFSEYSYPVFANTELAGSVPDEFVDRVFFIDGVSNDLVTSITQLSVEAGQDATDPDVALMAFAFGNRSVFGTAKALTFL
jgi:hypothetical protein